MVPILYNGFHGNGVVEVLLKGPTTDCVRDHHLLMVVPPRTRVPSSTWVATVTIESLRSLSPNGNGAEWNIHQDNEPPLCHMVPPKQNDKKARFSPSLLHRNMPP